MKHNLKDVIECLRIFNAQDNTMQVSMALTLLEIARADASDELIGVSDIQNKLGLHSGTASRNVAYWAKGAPNISKAMDYVSIDFHPHDRRLRSLRLTPKGKAFIRQITED